MNKKIISLLIGTTMLASTMPVFATTEGIEQGDLLLISAPVEVELNTFNGVVKEMREGEIVVTIDEIDYLFIPADDVYLTDINVGDAVEVKSPSPLRTKDIKTATEITKLQVMPVIAENDIVTYNSYNAVVRSFEDDILTVVIEEDMVVDFKTTDDTLYFSTDETAEEVEFAEGDDVIVVSTSLLNTRDIKFADVVVKKEADTLQNVFLNTFDMEEGRLISADGNLVLNVENPEEYAGKKLLVFYTIQTMSLPPQTPPERIVVIDEPETVTISFNIGDAVLNINGEKIEVTAPYIAGEGTTLVPLRVISEAFGAEVKWDGETKSVKIVDGETEISLQIASNTAVVNGEEKTLDAAPELTNDTTMVPLRFISETLGAEVGYVHDTQSITVSR